MPLVAFNNLDTLATEYEHTKVKKIILLNAFAGDFYYWTDTQQGVGKAPYIASIIKAEVIAQIIGNGGPLLRTELTHTNNLLDVQYIDELKDCCSLETAATLGAQRYATGQIEQQYITPLYFKQPLFFIP
jgi:tRNA A37 threonylcarbamoyladenosine modification protein TsaB